jgi:hypothetical protein
METPNTRADLRSPATAIPVYLANIEKIFLGYAANVSRSGALLKTYIPSDTGTEYDLEFSLPGTNFTINCRSRIVWRHSNPTEEGPCREGHQFVHIDTYLADKIENWVKEQLR